MPNMIERTVTKAAGKVGAARATIHGLNGVFRQASEEHNEAAMLLARAAATSDPDKRQDLWSTIRHALTAHEHAELEVVYAEFEMHASLTDIVRQHEAEADEIELLVGAVDATSTFAAEWHLNIKRLQAAVLRHAEREEQSFFPRAQATIGGARAEELEKQYLDTKQALLDSF